MALLLLLCFVGAVFGIGAFFRFIGLLVMVPITVFCILLAVMAFVP